MQQKPGIRQAVSALDNPDFRQFALALLVFNLVSHLHQTATAWQIYDLTGSPLQVGLTGLARAIPHVALSLVGGVVADRVDRIRMMMVSQATIGLLIMILAGLTASGQLAVWHVYVLTFCMSAVQAVATPSRTAVIPRLVPRERLVNAIAVNAMISQSSQIIGPSIAGVGIAAVGLSWTYGFAGCITLFSLASLSRISPIPASPRTQESPWQSLVDGLKFVRKRSVILAFMAMDVAETLFGSFRALLPFIAASLGTGPEGFGYLSAAPGAGSVIAATVVMSLGDMRYKGLFASFGILLYCVALVLLAVAPWFWLALLAAALLGFFNTIQVVPRNGAIMALSPDHLRGRVEAFRTMLSGGAPPLGLATSGAMAAAIGTPLALIVGAGVCTVAVLGIVGWHRELRDPELGTTRLEPVITSAERSSP
jgi:MFS family permease